MSIDRGRLEQALETLGALLTSRGHRFEIVVAGGSGLLLLGVAQRFTRDVDVLAIVQDGSYASPAPLPSDLATAATDVAALYGLRPDWLNAGPAALLDFGLPEGFSDRATRRTYGGLVVHMAARFDQVCLKLYAAADQGPRSKHAADLRLLEPTANELLEAGRWAVSQDPSPGFRRVLVEALDHMGVTDADERV